MAGFNVNIRNARANLIRNAIDAGVGPGLIHTYTTPRPATGGAIGGALLLGTCTFSVISAPDAVAGVLTFNEIQEDSSADDSGDAAWARITDSDGTFVMDVSVGLSDAEFIMNTVTIVAGGPIRIDFGQITEGNA